jgi:hypothetical protein
VDLQRCCFEAAPPAMPPRPPAPPPYAPRRRLQHLHERLRVGVQRHRQLYRPRRRGRAARGARAQLPQALPQVHRAALAAAAAAVRGGSGAVDRRRAGIGARVGDVRAAPWGRAADKHKVQGGGPAGRRAAAAAPASCPGAPAAAAAARVAVAAALGCAGGSCVATGARACGPCELL